MRKVLTTGFAAIAGVLVIYFVVSAIVVTDAKRVRRVMERARRSIVHHDLDGVMSCVDQSYKDDFGFNYRGLEQWFGQQFRRYDSLVCELPYVGVYVNRSEAACSLLVYFSGYSHGRRGAQLEGGFEDGEPVYYDRMVVYLGKFQPEGWLIVGAGP